MKSSRVVWWNGRFVPESQARISIYDSALMFGDVCFDMLRSFNKKIFKLREHTQRLFDGLKILEIDIIWSLEEIESFILETMNENEKTLEKDDEHRILIDVTRGTLGLYKGVADIEVGSNVLIADFPLRWTTKGMGKLFDKGINAVIPSQRTIPFNLLDQRIKNRNRIHFVMANLEVSKIPGDNNWALLLDPDGFITEGTGDNFFIVDRNGRIVTPRGLNILRGVSRAYIFELCRRLGFECIESDITAYDVYTAKEAFMTGTPFCMLPVTSLNSIKIGSGKVETNSTFYHLLNEWSKDVKVDIKKQIQEWDKSGTEVSGPTPYSFKK